MSSPAYRRDGLLIITFDESDVEDEYLASSHAIRVTGGDAAACCDEQPGPNLPAYQADAGIARTTINGPGLIGPGGGRIGAVLLSPFIKPGTMSRQPYNHYALLRSVEDVFGLAHLGFAGQAGLKAFGADIFTQPNGRAQ
jgi:phosphatidylinositol-3-phosphatase